MCKLRMLLVAALLAGLSALAQDSSQPAAAAPAPKQNRTHGDSAEKRLKRMTKRLNLTDEQQEKIRPILQDEEKQASAVDSDSTLTQQQRHKKMRQIHLTSRSQIDPILTAEQKAQMPSMRSGGGGGGRRHQRTAPTGAPSTDSANPQ